MLAKNYYNLEKKKQNSYQISNQQDCIGMFNKYTG